MAESGYLRRSREEETFWDTSGLQQKQRELTNFLRVGHWDVYIKRICALLFFNLQKTAKQQSLHIYIFTHIYFHLCDHNHLGNANANANTAKRGSVHQSRAKRRGTKRAHLVKRGVRKHVVVRETDARGDDRGGRCDGGDGGGRPVGQQDVSLRAVQRDLLCGLCGGTQRNI